MAAALALRPPCESFVSPKDCSDKLGFPSLKVGGWGLLPASAMTEVAAQRHPFSVFQDPLTGLANRLALTHILDGLIERERRFGLILLDLDGFKDVNDTLGHDVGDHVLQRVSAVLAAALPADAAVARLGGDEFAVVMADVACRRELLKAASQLCVRIGGTLKDESLAFVHASAGAALFPEHGNARTEILKCADIALYDAKGKGRNRAIVFQKIMQVRVRRRAAMLQRAAACVEGPGKLLVFFQPKLDFSTGSATGYEALLRCRDHRGRLRSPAWIEAAFADDILSRAIGDVVLEQSLDFLKILLSKGRPDAKVAINVTRMELFRKGWAGSLLKRLRKEDIPASALELEVNESVLLGASAGLVVRTLHELHDAGIRVSLDDFGTGYASLKHLQSCPVDALKIDRSFIAKLSDLEAQAIVKAIIDLGRALHMVVIAEGVEDEYQHRLLLDWGCHEGQGHLYSRPQPKQRWTRG